MRHSRGRHGHGLATPAVVSSAFEFCTTCMSPLIYQCSEYDVTLLASLSLSRHRRSRPCPTRYPASRRRHAVRAAEVAANPSVVCSLPGPTAMYFCHRVAMAPRNSSTRCSLSGGAKSPYSGWRSVVCQDVIRQSPVYGEVAGVLLRMSSVRVPYPEAARPGNETRCLICACGEHDYPLHVRPYLKSESDGRDDKTRFLLT